MFQIELQNLETCLPILFLSLLSKKIRFFFFFKMIEEKLPPLSPNSQKSNSSKAPSDAFVIAQLRGEMMKVQQSIQRLSSDYDQLASLLPDGLALTLTQYESNSHILDTKVTSETSRNWLDELGFLSSTLESINYEYNECNNRLKKTKKADIFEKNCNNFELKLYEENKTFLENLEQKITERISEMREKQEKEEQQKKETEENEKEEEPDDKLRLTAMIVEFQNKQNEEKVYTKKHPDPELSLRIKRHTDRIRRVEDLIQYYSQSIKPATETPIAEIKELFEKNKELAQQVGEKFQGIINNKSKPSSTLTSAKTTPLPFFNKEELRNATNELNQLAFDVTNKSQNYTKDIQKEAKNITDDIQKSLNKIRNVGLESEKSAKLAELIEENVEIMKEEPYKSGRTHLDENDAREEADDLKTQIDEMLDETNKKLENINKRLKKSLKKIPEAQENSKQSSPKRKTIPVNEDDN